MYQIKKIKDISKNVTDGVHSTVIDDKNGNGFLLSCKNIKNGQIHYNQSDRRINQDTLLSLRKRSKLEYDDILLTSVGTIGEVARVNIKDPNYEFQRSVGLIKPNHSMVLSKYLLYALQSSFSQSSIKSSVKGGVQPCLFIDDIRNVEIKLYDHSTQQHIVDSIGSVDDAIEKNEEIITKLEKYGLELYQFMISEKYNEVIISSLNVKYGVSIPANQREIGKYPLFASNGIAEYINLFNSSNTIIFGCRGTVGNVYYCKDKNFVLNTAFYIESKEQFGNLYFALKYNNGLKLYATGAAQPQITIENIQNVKIKIPTNNELNSILDYIYKLQNKNNNLKHIKKLLLNKYFD